MVQVAQNYAEWCGLAGLYLANLSHVDRYRTYAKALSSAGLTVVVVSEFIEDASPALDVNDWRMHRVYEFGPEQAERIERTASTLREIGAEKLAHAVATSCSNSPFDALQRMLAGGVPDFTSLAKSVNPLNMLKSLQQSLGRMQPHSKEQEATDEGSTSLDLPPQKVENRRQVEELLEQFAQSHREELQADINRHGDPRLEPRFTVERRNRELDALRGRWSSHQMQADAIETLTNVMKKIPKITTQKTEGKEKKTAQHIKQLVRLFREKTKELQKIAEADRSEQFQAFWPTLQTFESEWAELLAPDVIGDTGLRRAAEEVGEFSAESKRKSTTLEWEAPRGLKCDWTTFSLTVNVPSKSKPAIRAALQAVERLRKQFSSLQEDWRRQTLESFRDIYEGQMDDEELEEYDLDDDGEPTDAAILQHVESGSLVLSTVDAEGRSFSLTAYLAVEWDQEHGFELECDVDLDEEAAESAATFNSGDITLSDVGPKLSPEDLQRFESTFHVNLPGDYREFLLQSNGGVPSKPYIVLSRDGMENNWHVVRFLSFSGTASAPFPAESLEGRLHLQDGSSLAAHLLPIARVRNGSFNPLNQSAVLAILLSGKKAGKIALFDVDLMLEPLLNTGETFEMALNELIRTPLIVAKDFSSLWRKLQPAPEVVIPNWLQFIRKNDVEAFLAWAAGGGKISERLIEPGADFQPTVVDLLTAEATDELLDAVIKQKVVKPKHLRDSWRQYLFLDVLRFRALKLHLPKDQWQVVFASPAVWDHSDLLEELATAGVNIEAPLDDGGETALHRAVQLGRKDAVRWLLDHGADPKKPDRYGRNALLYAESGPGQTCLALLEGRQEPAATGHAVPDAPGIAALVEAAAALAPGLTLRFQIEMTSPPETRIEKVYYAQVGCHYRLTFEVNSGQVTFNDTRSPRQDYLHGKTWTAALFAPITQWPQLTPLWETLAVQEFDLKKAIKSRKYEPTSRPDLLPAARSALEQAFDPQEAAARGICSSQ